MAFPFAIQLNSGLLPQLLAILGLLMTWEFHDIQVRAGRITPRSIFKGRRVSGREVSGEGVSGGGVSGRRVSRKLWRWCKGHAGVHMHVLMTPNDERGCKACQLACGKVFSATAVRKKNFRGPHLTCRNPSGCRCELVGLVGNNGGASRGFPGELPPRGGPSCSISGTRKQTTLPPAPSAAG